MERAFSYRSWFKVRIWRAPALSILSVSQQTGRCLSASTRPGSTWIIGVWWESPAASRAWGQRAVPASTWGYRHNAAACLTDRSHTQDKMLFLLYTLGIDSYLSVSFCSVTVLLADAVGQSVNKNSQAGGQGATFRQKSRFAHS